MLEEELKNRIWQRYFKKYDCAEIIKRIDFTVKSTSKINPEYLFWAEAKQSQTDIFSMLTQLLVTIKQDAYNILPPKFIGCFDSEKIAFVEYNEILPIYSLNDFNWRQTPSQVNVKSIESLKKILSSQKIFTFYYGTDDDEIRNFIEQNFTEGGSLLSTLIDKNNFIFVYQKWREMVMPSINADWKSLKDNYKVYDRDFFLAELNIDDNNTIDINDDKTAYADFYIKFDASVQKCYQLSLKDNLGIDVTYNFGFKRGGLEKYIEFWKRYKRPPKNIYWNYIISRLDLLVPQDVRERKGAFFTPQIWVEKSQHYLAEELGGNWQEEYYIWDCCAGTGNLLNGLTNKYKIFASTIDQQDVDVMKDRINNGANLLESHVFQFDFLNDIFLPQGETAVLDTDFGQITRVGKLPEDLYKIIIDPQKRKKLVIYINPPYKEATSARTTVGTGENQSGVAISTLIYKKYGKKYGKKALMELYIQFFTRIYEEIPDCILGNFSTLKMLQSLSFRDYRNVFKAKLKKLFLIPADTFDNVSGKFPIGFHIWDTSISDSFKGINANAYSADGRLYLKKKIQVDDENAISLSKWIRQFSFPVPKENAKGLLDTRGNDFQNQKYVYLTSQNFTITSHSTGIYICRDNLLQIAVFFAVRHCIKSTWLNDRDQFLAPITKWAYDIEFQTNCLIYMLFHSQNKISSNLGTNHFIPFKENDVNAKGLFDSHFMSDFMSGKVDDNVQQYANLFKNDGLRLHIDSLPLKFSVEAEKVLECGLQLWKYYHTMEAANVNASLYDIKEFFQGRDKNGKMYSSSDDNYYTELIENLKSALWNLGEQIKPKVYEYGFLE